jgi:YD repeat-containing protein
LVPALPLRLGKTTRKINSLGQVVEYIYNANGILSSYIDTGGVTHSNDFSEYPNALTFTVEGTAGQQLLNWREEYAENGALKSRQAVRTRPDGTSQKMAMTFASDSLGNVLQVSNNLGLSINYTYDAIGKCVEQVGPNGEISSYEYDATGQCIAIMAPDGSRADYEYDPNGRLIATTANGFTNRTFIDACGRPKATIQAYGTEYEVRTDYQYDAAGRIIEKSNDGRWQRYEYDACGRVAREYDWTGSETARQYDNAGRITKISLNNGLETTLAYDASGRRTRVESNDGSFQTYEYDAKGRVIRTIDSTGIYSEQDYDDMGNVLKVSKGSLTAGKAAISVSYQFDNIGWMTSQTDALGRTTRFDYDAAGRIVQRGLPTGGTETWSYDGGRPASVTRADGKRTNIAYDDAGRVASLTITAPDGATGQMLYRYNEQGRVSEIEDSRGISLFTYDALGRITCIHDPINANLWYDYFPNGKVKSVHTIDHRVEYTYDPFGRLASLTSGEETVTYSYNSMGGLESVSYPNGVTRLHNYDLRERTLRTSYAESATGTELAWFSCSFDTEGRRRKHQHHSIRVRRLGQPHPFG